MIGGCSGGGDDHAAAARPAAPPTSALRALLSAEQRGDHAASFALLSTESRSTYSDVDDWARLRSQVPAVTGFTIQSSDGDSVVAIVEHEPGLDPFIGLSPARTRETWTARVESGSWRLDAEPKVKALLPTRAGATKAALAWARAAESCDASTTMSFQAVTRVFGSSEGAAQLCGSSNALTVTPTRVPTGPQTADLISQYTNDALSWATAVRVDGTDIPFSVVLAPIGDTWKVVAVFDAT